MKSVKLMNSILVAAALAATGSSSAAMVEEDVLRTRTDAARGRVWVLGVDDVRVYEAGSKRLIRKIVLPGWSVARFVCGPDLALDRSGNAVIASNVQSRLWRVDGGNFAVSEREIALTGRERWDMGFGALAFAGDGSLLGLAANANSLWRIDAAGARASLVETYHPPLKDCAVPAQRSR